MSLTKLFLPFLGEFGWLVMHYVRLVHFTEATYKIVCCQRGQECLFPTADEFFYDWKHPLQDWQRVGTDRQKREWPEIEAVFPNADPIQAGGVSFRHEAKHCIRIDQRIPIRPNNIRGLKVDVCIGVRARGMHPQKNWPHWPIVARSLSENGFTFAVIGCRETSYPLRGMACMSGDFGDLDAAVELLQNCRLFVGTDSGGAHLASLVNGCPMVVMDVPDTVRHFIPRMQATTDHEITIIGREHWNSPNIIRDAIIKELSQRPSPKGDSLQVASCDLPH
jgi:hypothetical protein